MSEEKTIDRAEVENLLKRRFFYDQSFSIYGGVNGLYDYGPVGCAIKSNILNQWRRHFILEEQMLEIDCSILTPEIVLNEFTVAEIEHFVDPIDKTHPKFETVADLEIQLYSANNQVNGESAQLVRLDDAVRSNVINNETLAYFIGRIYLFFTKIGIDKNRIRFRQHMSNEMAHYASDCWDVECKISYGWIECGACADRSSYDLNQHIKFSGQRLTATRQLSAAKTIQVSEKKLNSKIIGQSFRADASKVIQYLQNLSEHDARSLHEKLQQAHEKIAVDGKEFIITTAMFTVETTENIVQVEEFIPCVIEPTFGIGRIMYTTLEHNFKVRSQDEQRK
ncbi:unnamed protein product, partial [Rotaria magnacalcarata]